MTLLTLTSGTRTQCGIHAIWHDNWDACDGCIADARADGHLPALPATREPASSGLGWPTSVERAHEEELNRLREALDDLWMHIGQTEIQHLQPETVKVAENAHLILRHA